MKAQLALRMKYRLKAARKRHCVPHGSGARARAKFQFIAQKGGFLQNVADVSIAYQIFGTRVRKSPYSIQNPLTEGDLSYTIAADEKPKPHIEPLPYVCPAACGG